MKRENETTLAQRETSISLAHDIASKLWDAGIRGSEGATVLAMALGIYMEAQEGSHRNLRPVADAVCRAAQMSFDALRAGRNRSAAHG